MSVCSILAVLAVSMVALADVPAGEGQLAAVTAPVVVTDPADATVAVEVVAPAVEVVAVEDVPVVAVTDAVLTADAVVVPDAQLIPNLVVPQNPDQVGQQVVQAADSFSKGAWIAGIVLLVGVAIFFVNRFVGKKATDKTPPQA